jgi:transcriptional regulator with XRE-family HTH domain
MTSLGWIDSPCATIIGVEVREVDYLRGKSDQPDRRYRRRMATPLRDRRSVGDLLREWRQRRRMTQLFLALEADISARHLCFVESGRAQPSREVVMRLAERLDLPLRDRNALLLAAGYAPAFDERPLADPALADARRAVDLVLAGHEPYPAVAIDRHWTLVAANRAVAPLLAGVPPPLLQPPLNVLRLSLHPEGLAPRILNLGEWRHHLLARLRRQVEVSADPVLAELARELRDYPGPSGPGGVIGGGDGGVVVPLRMRSAAGVLSFISTTTVFGTPVEVTLSELALETLFPADAATAAALRGLAAATPGLESHA